MSYELFRERYANVRPDTLTRPFIFFRNGRWSVYMPHEHMMLMTYYPERYSLEVARYNKAIEFMFRLTKPVQR